MPIINYKKYVVNIILGRKRNKNLLKTHHCSVVDTTPPPKKAYLDAYNAIVKGCLMISKEVEHTVKVTTWKANQIKNNEVKISCLYLIN